MERAWTTGSYFTRFEVQQQAAEGGGAALCLWFVNADSVTKLGVHVPVGDLAHVHVAAPQLRVTLQAQVGGPELMEEQAAQLAALLRGIPPGHDYLARVCFVVGEVLKPAGGASQGDAAGGEAGLGGASQCGLLSSLGCGAEALAAAVADAGSQLSLTTPARVFTNPLFANPAL